MMLHFASAADPSRLILLYWCPKDNFHVLKGLLHNMTLNCSDEGIVNTSRAPCSHQSSTSIANTSLVYSFAAFFSRAIGNIYIRGEQVACTLMLNSRRVVLLVYLGYMSGT